MPAPAVALAGAALRNPRRTGRLVAAILALLGLWILFLIGAIGSITGLQPLQDSGDPSPAAVADIPGDYLELYQRAGARYGVDPWVLAAIGKIETDHGRSPLPGIRRPTTNTHGCCAGPMQMCVIDGCPPVGSQRLSVAQAQAGTWRTVGVDGNRDGQRDPWDPADAIPAAARLLIGAGAPADYSRAIFAYNHAGWYVADVLAQADAYRDAAAGSTNAGSPADAATVRELLANRRLVLTPGQRADLQLRRPRRAAARHAGLDRGSATRSWSPPCAVTTRRGPTTRPAARSTSAPSTASSAAAPAPARARPWCASSPPSPARTARPSSSTAGTPTALPTLVGSRAPITATTSTGAWTHDAPGPGATRRP